MTLSALSYQALRTPLGSSTPLKSYMPKNLLSHILRQQLQPCFKIPGNRFFSFAKQYAYFTIKSQSSENLFTRDISSIGCFSKIHKCSVFKEFHTYSKKGLYKNDSKLSLISYSQSFTFKYFKQFITTFPSSIVKNNFRQISSFIKKAHNKPYESTLITALTLSFLIWLVSNKIFCEASAPGTPDFELLLLEEKTSFDEISENDIPIEDFEDIRQWNITVDLIKNHWNLAVLTVVSAIITTLISLKIPIAIGSLVNIISKSLTLSSQNGGAVAWDVLNELRAPSLHILFLFIAHASAMASHILLVTYLGEQLGCDLRSRLYQQCLSLDLHQLDSSRSGELTNIINSDVGDFKQTFKQCLTQGVRCVTMLGGTAFQLYSLSPTLSGYLATLIPIFYACLYVYGKTLRRCRSEARNAESVAAGMAQEVLGAIRTVRAYAAEDWEVSRYDNALSDSNQANMLFGLHMGLFRGGMTLSVGSVILIVLYFGGQLVLQGVMQPGELMTFLVATENAQKALDALGGLLGQAVKAAGTGSRLLDFLSISPSSTMKALHGTGIILPQIHGSITFRDVEFSYSGCDTPSVNNLDLHVPAGTTLALVGASGAGKSTVASLLERFYELNKGVILIDGVPLHLLDPKWLRGEVIGFLSQEPTLFAGTIAENICYGSKIDPLKGRSAIQSAAEAAHIHHFIETLPQGYDTVIGERGASLSGGQKQRVAIARALLKDPKILILDEATSALDGRAEAAVQAALQTLMANRTTVIIAHRLSTIQGAQQIVVMGPPGDSGSIIEKGSHQELLKKKGAYYSLFQKALPS